MQIKHFVTDQFSQLNCISLLPVIYKVATKPSKMMWELDILLNSHERHKW